MDSSSIQKASLSGQPTVDAAERNASNPAAPAGDTRREGVPYSKAHETPANFIALGDDKSGAGPSRTNAGGENQDATMSGDDAARPDEATEEDQPQMGLAVETANPYGAFSERAAKHHRALEIRQPPALHVEDAVVDTLPDSLKGKEDMHDQLYPEYLQEDTGKLFSMAPIYGPDVAYRQKDRPTFPASVDQKGKSKGDINGQCFPAAIHLTGDGEDPELLFGTVRRTWTSPESEKAKGKKRVVDTAAGDAEGVKTRDPADPRKVSVTFNGDTQRSSWTVNIHREDGSFISCDYFASALDVDQSGIGMRFGAGRNCDKKGLPKDEAIQDCANANNLWRTDMMLRGPPLWNGISRANVELYKTRLATKVPQPESDTFIARLDQSKNLAIYIDFWETSAHLLEPFFKYFSVVSWACGFVGNFWWYRNAYRDGPLEDEKYPFAHLPPPKWLGEKYKVTYEDGRPTKFKCLRWAAYRPVHGRFPDASTDAFEIRLALARQIRADLDLVNHLIEATSDDSTRSTGTHMQAHFIKATEGGYVVNIKVSHQDRDGLIPEVGRVCVITVTVAGKPVQLKGNIIEDVFTTGDDLSAWVTPVGHSQADIPEQDVRMPITLTYPSDTTANNRAMNSVTKIQMGQMRKFGVFVPGVAFKQPAPNNQMPGWLDDVFKKKPEAKKRFDRARLGGDLNESQISAIEACCLPNGDVVCIWGPAGTGKTRCVMVLVCCLVAAGINVLVTAPTNSAVDACIDEFAKFVSPNVKSH